VAEKRKTELDVDPTAAIEEEAPQEEVSTEETPAEESEETPKLKSKKRIIIIGGVVAIVIITGVILFFVVGGEKEPSPTDEVKTDTAKGAEGEKEIVLPPVKKFVKAKKLINFPMEPFTLFFTENKTKGIFRIRFELQLSNKEVVNEMAENLITFRNTIFVYLKEHTKEDFIDPEKRQKSLDEIRVLLDRSLQNGQVLAVLITESNLY